MCPMPTGMIWLQPGQRYSLTASYGWMNRSSESGVSEGSFTRGTAFFFGRLAAFFRPALPVAAFFLGRGRTCFFTPFRPRSKPELLPSELNPSPPKQRDR